MKNKPVVIVVEDDKTISDFLVAKLEADGFRVIPVFLGQEAVSLISTYCPDLVLLNLGLPDIDGMEVLAFIRSWSTLPVIVVSARQHEDDIVKALDSGADDYVTKPFNHSVLMARIRAALRKETVKRSDGAHIQSFNAGALRIDYDKRLVTLHGKAVHFTPVEYKILSLLARNCGKVIPYEAIRRALWGPYAGDNRNVRVNMANLRRKIEENSADPRYILTEVGVGYRMIEVDNL